MNKTSRLKKNYEIESLMKNKKSVGSLYYAIYYQYKEEQKPKIAISVSKKLGNAVDRNYKKRVIREILRNNLSLLTNLKLLIVERKKASDLTVDEKSKELLLLIKKIRSRTN